MANKTHSEKIEAAELNKINSEINRNKAEQEKLLNEAKEINHRISKKIFQKDSVVKAIIGGIVAAALLSAWVIGYLQPILEKNQELASIENKILAFENKKRMIRNQEDSIALYALKKSTNKDLRNLQIQNDSLKNQQAQSKTLITNLKNKLDLLATDYQRLSRQQQSSISDKTKFSNLAKQAIAESNRLMEQIRKINIAQQRTENRSVDISDKLLSNWLMENTNTWDIEYFGIKTSKSKVWKFQQNGKLFMHDGPDLNNTWNIKDGSLVVKIADGYSTLTAKISDSKPNVIEGNGSNLDGKTWTWKMIKR